MTRKVLLATALVFALVFVGFGSASAVVTPHANASMARVSGTCSAKLAAVAAPAHLTPLAKTTYVYITKTGKKYHRAGCRYLKKSKKKVTLKWAKSHGYTACKVCKPPK
jgi:hypothetical protein